MKQVLLMIAAVALVGGCSKDSPNEAANELFVEAVELISRADETTGQSAIDLYEQGLGKLEEIITKHSKSDLAVKLISGGHSLPHGYTSFTPSSFSSGELPVSRPKPTATLHS
ncbi:hypothetical protein OAL58_02630, partial [Verrucomicrobia bacterium]|nr:hypothetical protein [Verrucomicrobiota bacterium]